MSISQAISLLVLFAVARTALTQEPPLEKIMTIPLHGREAKKLDHMAFDAKRDRLLVANMANRTFDVIDVKNGKLLREIGDQKGIQGVAYSPELDRVFVGLGIGGNVNAFDGETYALLKSVKFTEDSDNVRYDPRTKSVYVAHVDKYMGVMDAKTYEVKKDLTLPAMPEAFWIAKKQPRLYVNVPALNQVIVIDTEKNEIADRFTLKRAGTNYSLALDEERRRIYVGCRKEPMMVVLDLDSGKELSGVPIPGDIDDLFYDAHRDRLYASCGEGFLAVLGRTKGDQFEVIAKLPTGKLARTCYFDADSSRLFLAVPRQEGQEGPAIWVYRAKP
ncbi:MAG: hypothetical protein WCL32_21385 [Planctomycetota bacterium]